MKTSKWLAITLAAAVAVGGLTTSSKLRAEDSNSSETGAGQRRFPGGMLARIKEKLDLSDDQVTKIKAVLNSEKGTLTPLLKSLRQTHSDLRDVIQKSGATESEIRAAAAKVAAVESDLAVERAKLYGKISPILTPDQIEMIGAFQERMDEFLDNAIVTIGERLGQ